MKRFSEPYDDPGWHAEAMIPAKEKGLKLQLQCMELRDEGRDVVLFRFNV